MINCNHCTTFQSTMQSLRPLQYRIGIVYCNILQFQCILFQPCPLVVPICCGCRPPGRVARRELHICYFVWTSLQYFSSIKIPRWRSHYFANVGYRFSSPCFSQFIHRSNKLCLIAADLLHGVLLRKRHDEIENTLPPRASAGEKKKRGRKVNQMTTLAVRKSRFNTKR